MEAKVHAERMLAAAHLGSGSPGSPGSGPLGSELVVLSTQLSRCQYRLLIAAAAFAESPEWIRRLQP